MEDKSDLSFVTEYIVQIEFFFQYKLIKVSSLVSINRKVIWAIYLTHFLLYFSVAKAILEIALSVREGVKKNKKKVVILLQPPSIYLPTPVGVQKATFLIFF